MNIVLLLIVLFSLNFKELSESDSPKISDSFLNCSAGLVFESASRLAQLGWEISLLSPWSSTVGNEFLLFSHLYSSLAQQALSQVFKKTEEIHPSLHSWHLNQAMLSQIPAFSNETKQLLLFLEKRWLAKSCGFYASEVDWIYPIFGFNIQVNPMTTNSYARDPKTQSSKSYVSRSEAWKQFLPHPQYFPLILTRPSGFQKYLPSCLEVTQDEKVEATVERIVAASDPQVIVDLTQVLPDHAPNRIEWVEEWESYRSRFFEICKKRNVDINQVICIQRMHQEEVGGIRILPLDLSKVEQHHQFLLDWVSCFGLTANQIELDRWPLRTKCTPIQQPVVSSISKESKESFISFLNTFDWKTTHPQKALMAKGMVQVLKGLFATLKEKKWEEIIQCPTRSSIAYLAVSKIKEELESLTQEGEGTLFFDTASRIEQVNAHLSSLLEICAPFSMGDFSSIYQDVLISIPEKLKPLTSCGLHSSGMTSVGGILKAVEKGLDRKPRILYGENTYFECVKAVEFVSNASPIADATEADWKEVDLILAQFNPVWKRTEIQSGRYGAEKVGEVLRTALNAREGKPLTVALDCTLDFIDSPRVEALLCEFEEEILTGKLNIVGYRSGLKFDLFGMDNHCGAPFYTIHNRDPKWTHFDSLIADPTLQTDRLSLNWFCLAYKWAAPELELYRKNVFQNTRTLLNKMPPRLYNRSSNYRIIPVDQGADPSFIDINISGPFHEIRAAALVGGCFYLKCLKGGYPIFCRRSLGFYHINFGLLYGEKSSTIRLTLGLDPAEINLLIQCFEILDGLNGSPWQPFLKKLHCLDYTPNKYK